MRRAFLVLPLVLTACAPAEAPDRTTVAAGRAAFVEDCVACHGTDAKGAGPLALGLGPHPADLTRIAARHRGIFPRDEVMSTINGYTTDPTRPMPHFSVEDLGPLVLMENADGATTLTPERLLALANCLASIQE